VLDFYVHIVGTLVHLSWFLVIFLSGISTCREKQYRF